MGRRRAGCAAASAVLRINAAHHLQAGAGSLSPLASLSSRTVVRCYSSSPPNQRHHLVVHSQSSSQQRRRRQHHLQLPCSRCYATAAQSPERIAVIGAGLAGLTSAYYLAKWRPRAKIVLYEGSDRLGGWVRTERHQVTIGGKTKEMQFEFGPRGMPSTQTNCWRFDDVVLEDLVRMPLSSPFLDMPYGRP